MMTPNTMCMMPNPPTMNPLPQCAGAANASTPSVMKQTPITGTIRIDNVPPDPSIDRRMVDTQAPLAHHFLEVAVTHGIPQVPPNTQEDESWFELTPFERIVAGHNGGSGPVVVKDRPS